MKGYRQLSQETFFSKQSFHLWSITPDFQGKPTKHLSKINLEQNFKTHLEAKKDGLKWVSHFIELYNVSPLPSNLCMSSGYNLPNSLFPLRAKYLFFSLQHPSHTRLFHWWQLYIYTHTHIYMFLYRVHVIDSYLIKIREIVLNFCLVFKFTFSISDL